MTGYQSKKKAAQAKTIDEVNWVDHEPDGRRTAQEPWRESASDYERGFIDGMQKQAQSSVDKAVNKMAQRLYVGLTEDDVCMLLTQNFSSMLKREEEEKLQIIRQVNDFLMRKNSA
jgi:hypothetical protein